MDGMSAGRMWVELGIDFDKFKKDFAYADAVIKEASTQLNQRISTSQAKQAFDLAGAQGADTYRIKLAGLNEQIGLHSQQVALLTEGYGRTVAAKGKMSTEALRMQEQIYKERTAIIELEKSIEKLNKTQAGFVGKKTGAAISAFDAVAPMVTAAAGYATKMAIEAVESENLFAESFGSMATKARTWSVKLREELGLNEYTVRRQSGTFYVMFNSMGLGTQKAYELATGITQLSYDMASFYNLKPEEAFDKLRAGITGEIEPLRRLGILLDENTVKQAAYTKGIAQQGVELTEQQKVMARWAAILQQTTNAQGDMARTVESPANQLRVLQARTEQLAITIGQHMLPNLIASTKAMSGMVETYQGWSDGAKNAAGSVAVLATKLAGLSTAMTAAAFVIGAPLPPLAKLGVALGVTTMELTKFLEKMSQTDSYNEGSEVRFNALARQWEKRVELQKNSLVSMMANNDFGPLGMVARFLVSYEPLSESEKRVHEAYMKRKKELEDSMRAETGKVDPIQLKHQLKMEFDDKYREAETARLEQETKKQQQQIAAIEQQEQEKRKAGRMKLESEITKLVGTTTQAEIKELEVRVEEYRKAGLAEQEIEKFKAAAIIEINRRSHLDLESARASAQDNALKQQLVAVEQQTEAWRKAGMSQIEIEQATQDKKDKIIRDSADKAGSAIRGALMGGWGDVVNAIKDALDKGEDAYSAMYTAMEKNKKNLENERKAIEMIGSRLGLSEQELQLAKPRSPEYNLELSREQAASTIGDTGSARYLSQIATRLQEVNFQPVVEVQAPNITVNIPITVTETVDTEKVKNEVAGAVLNALGGRNGY